MNYTESAPVLEGLLVQQEDELFENLVRVTQLLAEHETEIVDDDMQGYAESLLAIADEEGFSLDEKDFFGKVGKGIRTLAHNIGRAQGAAQGVKDRWSNFKKGVFAANQSGRARGHASTSTDQTTKNQPKGKGNRPKGWKQQAQQQSFKAKNRGAKAGDKSTRKDGTVWQKEKDGSWTQVNSGKKQQPKLRLVKPLAASAELGDIEARLDEILARMTEDELAEIDWAGMAHDLAPAAAIAGSILKTKAGAKLAGIGLGTAAAGARIGLDKLKRKIDSMYPVGTVRKRKDGNYRKGPNGIWVRVSLKDGARR